MDRPFRSHDAFEKALRQYGHPAVVSEFNGLSRPVQRRMLEALPLVLRDNTAQYTSQQLIETDGDLSINTVKDINKGKQMADPSCPLVQALVDYGMAKHVLTQEWISYLRDYLGRWGAPSPSSRFMLAQHHQRVMQLNRDKASNESKGLSTLLQSSKSVVKEDDDARVKWSNLKRIRIRDLKLFDTSKGCMLEGKLMVDPFTPMVGTTTLVQDDEGNMVLVALYNFLPEGASGASADAIANAKLPKGATVRIAEPFLKVFRDGSRGIRIDSPHEIQAVDASRDNKSTALQKAKKDGNKFFSEKLYQAAAETYVNGLRSDDFVATVLSNRAQASLNLQDWADALSDSAASLTLRPDSDETWARYRKALAELGGGGTDDDQASMDFDVARSVMTAVLSSDDEYIVKDEVGAANETDAESLKAQGNSAFAKKDYQRARNLYSHSLRQAGVLCRTVLSNWSLCALRMGTLHDALAASAASLRIHPDGKAAFRFAKAMALIGEPRLSQHALKKFENSFDKSIHGSVQDLRSSLSELVSLLEGGGIYDSKTLFLLQPDLLPDWPGNVETFLTETKGRGVRATANLIPGEVVLIERPILSAEFADSADVNRYVMSLDAKHVDDVTKTSIKSTLVNRSARDGLLSRIVDNLYDGQNERPVVPLCDLMVNITSVPLLLPSHHEYMPGERIHLTAERAGSIISTNSHGKGYKEVEDDGPRTHYAKDPLDSSTELYPATSMINHSSTPTCEYMGIAGCSVLVAVHPVDKGEELSVCYFPDEEVVPRKWGF